MRKYLALVLLFSNLSFSQSEELLQQLGYLINDALFFSDKYITPATDAAVYQASSGWIDTPKKKKLWNVSLSVHTNLFFVPKRDQNFQINNSDFLFFQIENATNATVPTAIGNENQVFLVGEIDGNEVRLETPKGINQETVFYPYLQAGLGLWKGTEVIVKYSSHVKLKHAEYQVYGVGLKHNLDQYFKSLQKSKINLAALFAYSKEDISFAFLDVNTSYGTLGINKISGLVDTWQLQFGASKTYKKFELSTGIISNVSNFKYRLTGARGSIEEVLPFQQLLNKQLKDIYKTKTNFLGEVSCRYQISKLYLQTTLGFGKFVNSNFSVQYNFN